MIMNNDGILTMPNNFSEISTKEMEYINGGWAIESRWFGFSVYLTHKERVLLTDGQAIGGGIGAVAAAAFPVMAIPLLAGLTAAGTIVWNHDEGHGVKINFAKAGKIVAPTGFFALTATQEEEIAASNSIIF